MLTIHMSIDNRILPRFQDFARASITDLCQLPGFLEDVSANGCKVRFSHVFDVDTDREYTLTVLPALRSGISEFDLTVRPQWIRKNADSIDVGFYVLHCPGIRQFMKYVKILAQLDEQVLQEA